MNTIVLDTETTSLVKTTGVQAELMRVYDLGWCVMDTNDFTIVRQKNYAIMDVFNNARLMGTAYYRAKLPWYYEEMRSGRLPQVELRDACGIFEDSCKDNGVHDVWAYNCRFDYTALNATIDDFSNGYRTRFFPSNVRVYDIMSAAVELICDENYCKWAKSIGAVTAKGNPRATAETVYNYVAGVLHDEIDDCYEECHTALDDSRIEARILQECLTIDEGATYLHGAKWGKKIKAK